jgi:hypothetical protein
MKGRINMSEVPNIKRVCGFCVSSTHLVTMLLPYINKELNNGNSICSFLGFSLKEQVETLLSNVMLEENTKHNVLMINWNETNSYKYSNIEKELESSIGEAKRLNIIVTGSEKYINSANENLDKFFNKNNKKIKGEVTVINCYEVSEFNDNIKNILDIHDKMINTSGIHEIEELFEGYKKRA